MRLIDADELIKCIPSEECNSRFAVMNAPTVELQKWIPCSERLPDKKQNVIVTVNYFEPEVETDIWDGCLFLYHGEAVVAWMPFPFPKPWEDIWDGDLFLHNGETVTAWMPLPDSYKEEE